ncbi:hypothetical protein IFM89_019174 [Coptis chinensis]|uniref:Uncharacterized protein n=1 Tax=Coptis chinensis TaxID=261450 RepID=A0A835GXA2_9MAGN|nr:hypothetical protein IFM89_019174 [Coptis chinensis]
MGVDETSDTPMEVNNTQDSSVERTGRGAVQCKRITKMREGELLNVQYNEDGQRIGEGGKDLASYSGQIQLASKAKKKGVVSDIGEKWKEFKSRLTSRYPSGRMQESTPGKPSVLEESVKGLANPALVQVTIPSGAEDSGKVFNMSYLESLFSTRRRSTGSSKSVGVSPYGVGLTILLMSPHPTLLRKRCRVGVGKQFHQPGLSYSGNSTKCRPDGPKRKRVFVKVVEALVDVEGMVLLK